MKRSECIKNFLRARTHEDLANLYHAGMECQVNVAQDGGHRVDGEFKGRRWQAWTDNVQTWNSFRIPLHANSEPEDNDKELNYDLDAHAEAIGMTGWDWQNKVSKWVGFDFDSIINHQAGLNQDELAEIVERVKGIDWITIRYSTSGKGIHLYVHVPDIDTQNHNEHAALARAILGKMAAITGFDFAGKIDVCGGNMWVWHRKMAGTNGLSVIKTGSMLVDVPANWRDHIPVVSSKASKARPQFIAESQTDVFEELSGQRSKVPLDTEHRKLIDWLSTNGALWWWVQDHHMLVTHTIHLKEAHEALKLRGKFDTTATGKERGADHNCFLFPLRRGGWAVRRYTQGVTEASTWTQDAAGWTRCFFNRDPDLATACRSSDGVEHPSGGFVFREAELASKAAIQLGVDLNLPNWANGRSAKVKAHSKDNQKLIVEIEHRPNDHNLEGWLQEKGHWKKVFSATKVTPSEAESPSYDDLVRHLVTANGEDYGWVLKNDEKWHTEPLVHIRACLKALGIVPKEVDEIVGSSVMKCWTIVNIPFKEEYPGDRQWNRNAAQFRFTPTQTTDTLQYPSWTGILQHVGASLDSAVQQNGWCAANGILTGADYLKCWIASLFQYPSEPLPYLFLYGPQNSGKSIFHEALSALLTKGWVRADTALISQSGFNAELENAIICVVEETDLNRNHTAYNRIKDWVTSRQIPIHKKGETPYSIPNTTHWVQCANSYDACPVFAGDTRITMIYVDSLDPLMMVPKNELMQRLNKEAPDFLAEVLKLELPKPNDRLNVPVIVTEDKLQTEELNLNELQRFVKEKTFPISGQMIKFADFANRFTSDLEPQSVHKWSKIRIGRELMALKYPKGRNMKDGAQFYIGNISFDPNAEKLPKLILDKDRLIPENRDGNNSRNT